MRRVTLAFVFSATVGFSQTPDVSQTSTLTGIGIATPIWAGSGGSNGTVAWRLTYRVDGTNFTAASVAIKGANAASASACQALTSPAFTTVPNSGDSVPCVVAAVTGVTGSGGTVNPSSWATSQTPPGAPVPRLRRN